MLTKWDSLGQSGSCPPLLVQVPDVAPLRHRRLPALSLQNLWDSSLLELLREHGQTLQKHLEAQARSCSESL